MGLEIEHVRPLLGALNSFRIDEDLNGIALLVDAVSGFTPFPFHVLPPRPWCCVGRDSVVRRLVQNLCGDHPHPAIIYGPPAIGKTTVCLEVLHAEQVRHTYGDRRLFLQLDNVETVDELVSNRISNWAFDPGEGLETMVAAGCKETARKEE